MSALVVQHQPLVLGTREELLCSWKTHLLILNRSKGFLQITFDYCNRLVQSIQVVIDGLVGRSNELGPGLAQIVVGFVD